MLRQISRAFATKPLPAHWVLGKYTPSDAKRIQAIALPVLHDLVSLPPSCKPKQKEKMYQSDVQRGLDDPTFTTKIFTKDKAIGGFITYHLSDSCLVGPTGIIEFLAVDPQHRKLGLGTLLLGHAVDDLKEKGARAVMLRITSNEIAPFYQRNGFKVLRHHDFRLQNAGSMGKILNPSNQWFIDSLAMTEKSTVLSRLVLSVGLIAYIAFGHPN